jgi:protein gp37
MQQNIITVYNLSVQPVITIGRDIVMGKTTIEWTATRLENGTVLPGYTFNPWWGCLKVSPGCEHCYADALARRYGFDVWGPAKTTSRRMMSENYWKQPRKWNKDAEADGVRRRVFCASMADVFEDHPDVEAARKRLFNLILETPNLDWLLLTKRPENILRFLPETWGGNVLPNMWLGTSVENQVQADTRIPELLKVPARVRFLSCEPLLGDINLGLLGTLPGQLTGGAYRLAHQYIHWVIVGGESGPQARPMHPEWARSLRDQCQAAGVSFFFKQWGEYAPVHDLRCSEPGIAGRRWHTFDPDTSVCHVGKARAGRLLDEQEWNEVPA